jgi:phosphoglycolate phosphatase
MKCRLVVFDLDGTLVDSRRDLAESANTVLAERGCRTLPEEDIGRMVGDGAATLVRRAFAAADCPVPADALQRFLTIYNSRLLRFTRAYPGVAETLETAGAGASLAVLTNKPIHATRAILEGLGLARFFPPERVAGGDGPQPRKPDPSGLLQLSASIGVPAAETLMVGDSIVDWETANAGGVRACIARYGFGFAAFPVERLRPDDVVIDAPHELLNYV